MLLLGDEELGTHCMNFERGSCISWMLHLKEVFFALNMELQHCTLVLNETKLLETQLVWVINSNGWQERRDELLCLQNAKQKWICC